jgi:ABC-type amino acid transport substrate-binding protein
LASQNDPILAVAPARLTQEAIGWAVHRDNLRLRDEANKAIFEWAQNGTLEAIFYQWGIPYTKK